MTETTAAHLAPGRFVERPTPTRWRADPEWSERVAAPLRVLAGAGARPTPEEAERLQRGLLQRDALADDLVRAVREEHSVTMAQFRTALEEGIESLPDAPAPLRALFDAVQPRPSWVDDELLDRGAQACRRIGWDGWDILAFGSLLGGYRTSAALEPLVRSGRLSSATTLRRIGETGDWWLAVTTPGGMRRWEPGWRLTLHVRVMHAFVNYQLERADDWDWDLRGVPINAYDQASTLGTFSTSYLLHARVLGIRVPRRDAAAVMHLWSYVGWLLGVPEEWLPRTERAGRRVLYRMLSGDPGPDTSSRALAAALMSTHEHYPGLRGWRLRFERERALSSATYLVSPSGMRELGLPRRPPWYPAYRVVSNVLWTQLVGRLPGGPGLLDRRGARALDRRMRLQYGDQRPPIGRIDASS
ncbi:MAG: DUF2236 domain-containing protein [Marmoricola sp.]|nr:DUF2236 domain-containing protein [Marmoricola sp.]